jgi:hypothetical protein
MTYNSSILFFLLLSNFGIMAQNNIVFENNNKAAYEIIVKPENQKAGVILKSYLDQSFAIPFKIKSDDNDQLIEPKIVLEISLTAIKKQESFIIRSDENTIHLIAGNSKNLRYAVYSLLEKWGFRKFIASETYIPEITSLEYPKNNEEAISPSFEYRALYYPNAFDAEFRDWHKLDWHPNDFGVWGHSFDMLLPTLTNFDKNPKLFALYEGSRRPESLCMTNDTVVQLITKKIREIIAKTPEAQFYSISQNDGIIYCECEECQKINNQLGGPQGSLYYFLNKIASKFPNNKIITLAYLHTLQPPADIEIAKNIYTLFCPIELDRGKKLTENSPLNNLMEAWNKKNTNLFLWDYTVQFSNYMSPFPNLHTFSENYKLYKKNNIKGLFMQGYADVPGDLSELRQYLLAKLSWDVDIDIEMTINDFLRGYYGKAAPAIKQYLDLLTGNQQKTQEFLDIYDGPLQSRNTFLTPEAMDQYDQILSVAEASVKAEAKLTERVLKIRMALEYVYFEQAKFYGKDLHGMFVVDSNGKKQVRENLTKRVKKFSENCTKMGIYELSEGGLSPNQYYEEWLAISKNITTHLGEQLSLTFLTNPAKDYQSKGVYSLIDGNRGYKNFVSNWVGWYGNNPEFTIETKNLNFSNLKINFLEDQRHWIFPPEKVLVYGGNDNKWELIAGIPFDNLEENNLVNIISKSILSDKFRSFKTLKIFVVNRINLPIWRKRKNKLPMVMIDEVELYK